MGIYDRQYVRVGPHSRSGLGNVRFISVNSWIIIINIAVFLLGGMLSSARIPVVVDRPREINVAPGNLGTFADPQGRPIYLDALGRPYMPPGAIPPRHQVYQELFDTSTNPPRSLGMQILVSMDVLSAFGHFSTARGFLGIEVWRFITFQFLHANFMHLFFNMFGLWIFGGMVEQYLGSKRYLAFYLTCGIFGAVAYLILNLLGGWFQLNLPGVIPNSIFAPLVGASAGVFGVILASAYIAPNAMIMLIIPPVPLKLKWFAYGYVAFAAANLFVFRGANIGGDAAHLGGAIAGAFFIRNAHLLRDFFEVFGRSKDASGARGPRPGPTRIEQEEVDRILGKVSRDGLQSLTEAERRTLRRASERSRR